MEFLARPLLPFRLQAAATEALPFFIQYRARASTGMIVEDHCPWTLFFVRVSAGCAAVRRLAMPGPIDHQSEEIDHDFIHPPQ
jgi:hypothetical protein